MSEAKGIEKSLGIRFAEVLNNRNLLYQFKLLYKEAFPPIERAPFFLLKNYAKKNKNSMLAIYDKENFVGMIYLIHYNNIVYILYFAITTVRLIFLRIA